MSVGADTGQLYSPVRRMRYGNGLIALLVTFGVSIVIYFVSQSIIKPLHSLSMRLQDIGEGEGDLTVSLAETGSREIKEVAHGFNTFVQKIRHVVADVKDASNEIAAMAENLSTATAQIVTTNEEISAQSAAAASSSDHIRSRVKEVAENAMQVSGASDCARAVSADGLKVVAQALNAMQEISSVVQDTRSTVESLGNQLLEVNGVVDIIEDVAGRTNLLALNATIEAARAGERGRGFAVVASEVKNLAQKTVQATQDIGGTLATVQTESKRAVKAVSQGESSVLRGKALGEKAREAIRAIEGQVEHASAQVQQIAAANEELTTTVSDLSGSVEHIANGMQENGAAVAEISQTAELVAERANALKQLAARFRTSRATQE